MKYVSITLLVSASMMLSGCGFMSKAYQSSKSFFQEYVFFKKEDNAEYKEKRPIRLNHQIPPLEDE